MRFLKGILISVLLYEAVYLLLLALLQALTGYDYTAAYAVGGAAASVELILCAIIKHEENKQKKETDYEN